MEIVIMSVLRQSLPSDGCVPIHTCRKGNLRRVQRWTNRPPETTSQATQRISSSLEWRVGAGGGGELSKQHLEHQTVTSQVTSLGLEWDIPLWVSTFARGKSSRRLWEGGHPADREVSGNDVMEARQPF